MHEISPIKATISLYRLTTLLPKKEPLRYKMRAVADDILKNSIQLQYALKDMALLKKRELLTLLDRDRTILNNYAEVVRAQKWVADQEVVQVQRLYTFLAGELEAALLEAEVQHKMAELKQEAAQEMVSERQGSVASEKITQELEKKLDERKEQILALLKEREKMQVWEVNELLPDVSKRTLRRDFQELLQKGFIERKGERNMTFYQLKR